MKMMECSEFDFIVGVEVEMGKAWEEKRRVE